MDAVDAAEAETEESGGHAAVGVAAEMAAPEAAAAAPGTGRVGMLSAAGALVEPRFLRRLHDCHAWGAVAGGRGKGESQTRSSGGTHFWLSVEEFSKRPSQHLWDSPA